jgi:hypothetical protein
MIYAFRAVKGFVQGCGGSTEVKEVGDSDLFLAEFAIGSTQTEKETEEDFNFLDQKFRPLIIAFSDMLIEKAEFAALLKDFSKALIEHRARRLRTHQKRRDDMDNLRREIEQDNP